MTADYRELIQLDPMTYSIADYLELSYGAHQGQFTSEQGECPSLSLAFEADYYYNSRSMTDYNDNREYVPPLPARILVDPDDVGTEGLGFTT